jgi:hypothetical protein
MATGVWVRGKNFAVDTDGATLRTHLRLLPRFLPLLGCCLIFAQYGPRCQLERQRLLFLLLRCVDGGVVGLVRVAVVLLAVVRIVIRRLRFRDS